MATHQERLEIANRNLELAKQKKKQAEELFKKAEARKKAAEKKKNRAMDTRKKILVGAMYLELMEQDESFKTNIMKRVDGYLKRDDDRALFGLPPVGEASAQPLN